MGETDRVSRMAPAPPSHYGTCAVCGEPTIWCMAGYWTHDGADVRRDHQAVCEAPGTATTEGRSADG